MDSSASLDHKTEEPQMEEKQIGFSTEVPGVIEQTGKVFVGTGAKKEAQIVGIGLGKLRASQLDDLHRAEQYAMDQSIKYVMQKQLQARQQHQQKVALYSQALSLMSRIYVGSINFDVFEDQIRDAFTCYGPIKTINMSIDPTTNHHKGFCFIEYEIPEAANIARETMNGRLFGGRNIKVLPVGRQDTMPQAQPVIDMVVNEARQYNRIYVASVHPDISEQDLRCVFKSFGEVTKCQLAKQPIGKGHRGFGYIEFKTAESVQEAIEGMCGFDLGGQFLQVGRAVAPPDAINYLSVGKSDSGALPAAAAIAAAEATARITAQEILGIGKTSPGSSPVGRTSSPAPTTATSLEAPKPESGSPPVSSGGSGSPPRMMRRRGFGGFAAGATVPPPSVIQSLPAPPVQIGDISSSSQQMPQPGAALQPTINEPQLIIPKLGIAAAPKQETVQSTVSSNTEESSTIDDFYSTLQDDTFVPPTPILTQSSSSAISSLPVQPPQPSKPIKATETIALPSPSVLVQSQPQQQKPKKVKKEKRDILDRIGEKAQIGTFDASKPASFAPLDPKLAPKDPNAVDEDEEDGDTLAIGGPESWYALALRDGGTVSKTGGGTVAKNKQHGKGGKTNDPNAPKRKRAKKPKLSSGPKMNTAQKVAAANLAGALSDQLSAQNAQNDEASLASQEHIQIRGNDARHLLIQKLMRTNRSSVIVMRNMVTPDGIDEYLEDEIREECSKYGRVTDVVIVKEQETHTVKIFVRFAEPVQAEEARRAIDGRYFDGRTVEAQSYDQTLFDHDDFTG